jgi:hypothetical protein
MILVRNVFRLKFGKAREGVAVLKEGVALARRLAGGETSMRVLTDLTGDFYTLVLEMTYPDVAGFDQAAKKIMGDPQWQANYQKLVPLVESGRREMFNVVDVGTGAAVA